MRSRSELPPEKASDPSVCRATALRLLNLRWQGEKELEKKLTRRGFEIEVVRETLESLRKEKWLDDRRFAREFARGRLRSGIGRVRIRRELEATGVDRELVPRAITLADEEAREIDQLRRVCSRKLNALRDRKGAEWIGSVEGRKKIVGFLLNRGYEYAAATEAYAAELVKLGVTPSDEAADLE